MNPMDEPATPTDLTGDAPWQYRVVTDERIGPWCATLRTALGNLCAATEPLPWPTQWRVFGPLRPGTAAHDAVPPEQVLSTLPDQLLLDGHRLARHDLTVDAAHRLDFADAIERPCKHLAAFAFSAFTLSESATVRLHLGCDYWMTWWLNGRPLFDNTATGNGAALMARATPVDVRLEAGGHVLAAKIIGGSGGWAMAGEMRRLRVPAAASETIAFRIGYRRSFHVNRAGQFDWVMLSGEDAVLGQLNARPAELPIAGLRYARRYASADALHDGVNTLDRELDSVQSRAAAEGTALQYFAASGTAKRLAPSGTVTGLTQAHAAIRAGPVITDIGTHHAHLSVRTNVPVPVTLRIAGRTLISNVACFHSWHVTELSPGAAYRYTLSVGTSLTERCGELRTLPEDGELKLIVCADAGPLPKTWERNAARIRDERPAVFVFVGDLVGSGRSDAAWDDDFFSPAHDLLANVPCLSVPGNHDEDSPLYALLLRPPGTTRHWSRRIGAAQLIGLDGADDWSPGSDAHRWLNESLTACDAPFVFVFNHYGAWTSGPHLRTGPDGEPVEPACRAARHFILPVLRQHGVTAVFSGHDHIYERSHPPGVPVCVVTGGAGAYLYDPEKNPGQNPYSVVRRACHHHCVLRVSATRCTLDVRDLEGHSIDQASWPMRGGD